MNNNTNLERAYEKYLEKHEMSDNLFQDFFLEEEYDNDEEDDYDAFVEANL